MRIEAFLLGIVSTTSLAAGLFFLKFWRRTRDLLFLCFAIAFFIEAVNRASLLWTERPNEASPWVYIVRLLAFLIILAGIVRKNYGDGI
jgi:uncharacterized membrane protein HdeD (DUF308 family)